MSDIQLSAEDQQKLDAAALKIQARARGMNTRRMSKDDLAVKAQESKRETKEERQARRKAEIQAANAKRHSEFVAEAQLDSAAPPEQSDAQAADEPAAPAAAAEAVTLSVPVDIFHGLSEEEIKRRNQAVVKIQSRARGVAVREVILGMNPDMEGESTGLQIASEMTRRGIKVTRLARGLPAGGQIEYASKAVLADAIACRQEL
jgi:hypothetical protein